MTVRVGITGYANEVNAAADPVTLGHGIDAAQSPGGLAATWEAGALVARLRALRPDADVVDLPVWEFGATGPLADDDFRHLLALVGEAIAAAGPLDAIVVLGHGAGRTSADLDPDGTFLAHVRAAVGDGIPIVVVLDFHANVSALMCETADVLVAYRTNPHVDIEDRLVEAAEHTVRLLDAPGTVIAHCRLPLVLPQIAENTTPGEPLADVVALGQQRCVSPVRNVSVLGSFALTDVPDIGVAVCVTADHGAEGLAASVAAEVASRAWALRSRYRLRATPLSEAVEIARRAARGEIRPVILADASDNPGGGAPGNSTFVLEALLAAGVSDVVMGLQCDRAAVDAAWAAGVGTRIGIEFNRGSERPLARPLRVEATVLALVDRPLVPVKGVYAGATRHVGRCCALDLGGIRIAVASGAVQCADDDSLLHVGLDPADARVVVVKSRGHFRAGFAHLFDDERIVEVGAPGVATVDLGSVRWEHLPRPVFPFDQIDGWEPTVALHRRERVS